MSSRQINPPYVLPISLRSIHILFSHLRLDFPIDLFPCVSEPKFNLMCAKRLILLSLVVSFTELYL